MNLSFLGNWRRRHGHPGSDALGDVLAADPAGVNALLAECELLRETAARAGVVLDDTPQSLAALDQLPPRWRDDPETELRLGGDAGLYLGAMIVRTLPGATWRLRSDGQPVVALASGRQLDVLADGLTWAAVGTPELAQCYAQASGG
jgi:hypothetical protein